MLNSSLWQAFVDRVNSWHIFTNYLFITPSSGLRYQQWQQLRLDVSNLKLLRLSSAVVEPSCGWLILYKRKSEKISTEEETSMLKVDWMTVFKFNSDISFDFIEIYV